MIDIKHWRNKRNLTRLQLAKMVQVSENYIYEIETNRKTPSLRIFFKIIDALQLELCINDLLENNVINE